VSVPWPWLTFEVALYILIVGVGLAVRLAQLDRWPLLEAEANTALAAWRTARGSLWRPTSYVPLLYNAQLLLFWLTRATDLAARLLPALVGAGLVALPVFARDLLGRKGAIVAALLLALTPTWVYFSRSAESMVLSAAASAVLLLALARLWRGENPRALRVGLVALALGLTAGPGFWTTLLALALFMAVAWWRWRAEAAERVKALGAALQGRDPLILFLGVFVFFASGFLVNPSGIGMSFDQLGAWLRGLAVADPALSWYVYPLRLLSYEFLTLALAVAGLVAGARRRSRLTLFLALWAGLALLLGTALGHREPVWLGDALLPLVLLAAQGAQWLWDTLAPDANGMDALMVGVGLIVIAFTYLHLVSFAHTGQDKYYTLARISAGVLVVAWAGYWAWAQRGPALRVGAVILVLLMIGITARSTASLAYETARNPRESMVYRPSAVAMRDLEALLTLASSHQVGDARRAVVEYEQTLPPTIAWALRDFPHAQAVASINPQTQANVLVTRVRPKEQWPRGYVAQTFRLEESWQGDKATFRDWLRWLFLHRPLGVSGGSEVQVWVRAAAANTSGIR
jgi:uncharacterized protein (TIGR03663 family)